MNTYFCSYVELSIYSQKRLNSLTNNQKIDCHPNLLHPKMQLLTKHPKTKFAKRQPALRANSCPFSSLAASQDFMQYPN